MRKWAFYLLWPNLAVAVVVLVRTVGNGISSVRELLHVLAYALVYANLVSVLGYLLVGGLANRWASRKLALAPALAVCVLLIVPVGCLMVQALLMAVGFAVPRDFWAEYLQTLRMCMPLALVFGLGAAVHASLRGRVQAMEVKLHEKEIAEQRTLKLAAEARLRLLESRIHPHFLFNTLNSISSLIAVDPARAEQLVGRLAALLRASLETSRQPLIPLREELAMVASYIDIEKARLGDRLRCSIDAPRELLNVQVPPMSVQSLVENAVKHGIAPLSGGGELQVVAAAENGSVRIEVRDSGPGFDLSAIPAGHGLDSLVERLHALFGAQARLNVLRRDGCCVVEMVAPRV